MSKLALVVDDSMLIRHTVCRFLEDRGFLVESASNGVEALEMLKRILPDVILTDLHMPKMDGRGLIHALRAKPQTCTIPIVILAVKRHPEEAEGLSSHYVIYKDIDIVAQLDRALAAVLPGSITA